MAASMNTISVLSPISMKVSKLKVKRGQQVSKGTLVCLYTTESNAMYKFKSSECGIVAEIIVKEGDEVVTGSVLFTIHGCSHPTVMKDMCADCGADLRIENSTAGNRKEEVSASVAMVHSIPELIVSEELAKELGKADEERLLKTRKLVLLVDLDQTLLHTTNDNIPANLKDVNHYQLWHGNQLLWYHTRFRPQTRTFLEHISKLYELHICTFGSRMYAHTIAGILDPGGKFFSHRILSRDECFNAQSKMANLKALFPCGDAMVCIIDDREDVWHYSPNLVHVKPYRFFQGTADINAPLGLTKTEQDSEPLVHRVRIVSQSSTSSKIEHPGERSPNRTEDNGEDTETRSDTENNGNTSENYPSHIKQKNENKSSMEMKHVDEKQVETEHVQSEDRRESDNEMDIEEHKFIEVEKTDKSDDLTSEEIKKPVESEDRREPSNEMDMDEIKCNDAENRDKHADSTSHEIVNTAEKIGEANIMETSEKVPMKVTDVDSKNEDVIDSHCESEKLRDESDETKQEEHKSNEGGSKEKIDAKSERNERKEEVGEGKKDTNEAEEDMIEWDDEDDYLLYLEEILKNIHSAFYLFYDKLNDKDIEDKEGKEKADKPSLKALNDIEDKEGKEKAEKPSLKNLIPYIKKKVLKGCNILFSGVIPTNTSPDKSRAYIVAKALGANVHTDFKTKENEKDPMEYTTHLVAAKAGTTKIRTAMKYKSMKKVNPDWLWSCSERWERVEEILFPVPVATESDDPGRDSPDITKLKNINVSKRKRDPESGKEMDESDTKRFKKVKSSNTLDTLSVEDEDNAENVPPVNSSSSKTRTFSMSYNPMLAFSDDDLAYMDKEVEDEMDDEDASSEDEEVRDNRMRQQVLKSKTHYSNDSSSEDSLSGDRPRGWGLKNKMSPKSSSDDEMKGSNSPDHEISPEYESETDQDKFDKIMEAFGPDSENSDEEYAESIGSVDEEIADAVMKEFLS